MHSLGREVCGGVGRRGLNSVKLVDFGLVSDSLEFMVRVSSSILIGSRECSNIIFMSLRLLCDGIS